MKKLMPIIVIIILLMMCSDNKGAHFELFFEKLKKANLIEQFEGVSNIHRRNNIFNFSSDTITVAYKLEEDGLEILKLSDHLIDTSMLKSDLKDLIKMQKDLGITGFKSSEKSISLYFSLSEFDLLPIPVREGENEGVLINSLVPLSNSDKEIERGWYILTSRNAHSPPNYF